MSSNKRIARNTSILYFRMLIIMGITLYTSRVVLRILGFEDFGIYNVLAGVILMFTFINSAMSNGTSRYIAFELGRGNSEQLKKIFSATLSIHIVISFVILVLAETIGLWFVYHKLSIPPDRMDAALWVYHFSVISCMITLTQVPYNAAIIAHEKMNFYAYISILDVSLKLFVIYILAIIPIDKLKSYAILSCFVTFIIAVVYRVYCKHKYKECTYTLFWEKSLYKELTHFSSWALLSNFSYLCSTQGANILLNLFFGPIVNAANAIALQVNGAVYSFVNNFRTAINPQIIKSYATGSHDTMQSLTLNGTKYSYFIMLFLTLPIILEAQTILELWLDNVPENAALFVQLVLIYSLIQTFDTSFYATIQAVGRLKENVIFSVGISILVLPVTYFLFKIGYPAKMLFLVLIFLVSILSFFIKPYLLSIIAKIKVRIINKHVFIPALKVTMVSIIIPVFVSCVLPQSILRLLIVGFVSCLAVSISVYFLGIDVSKRMDLKNYIKYKLSHFYK